MDLNKFDNLLKNKLENRRLQPSEDAWIKLANQLDARQKTKSHAKTYWLMGVAASVVGVFLVVNYWFNSKQIKPVIVDTTETELIETTIENTLQKSDDKPFNQRNTKVANQTSIIENTVESKTSVKLKTNLKPKENLQNTQVLPILENKLATNVVEKEEHLSINTRSTTDVYGLLKKAQEELKKEQITGNNITVVHAEALLESVETDLDQSFRSKVFEAIKTSYNTVKTAVASRNK